MHILKYLFAILITCLFFKGYAQILDDTTKNVYGPKSTQYILEDDVLNNLQKKHNLDTTLDVFHRYSFVQRYDFRYVDLGNPGSAMRPLFYRLPDEIGFRPGYNSYSIYATSPDKIQYYDTKSPYSKFFYVLGGKGVSLLETAYSRNINPNWNVGAMYNKYISNKQIGFLNNSRARETDHTFIAFHTSYKAKSERYTILANFTRWEHRVHESGGVLRDSIFDVTPFMFQSLTTELEKAESNEKRMNLHVFHQLKLSSLLQLYHVFDNGRQTMKYFDLSQKRRNNEYYPAVLLDTANTADSTIFRNYKNTIGLKGTIGKTSFRLFYERKNYFVDNKHFADLSWQADNFLGGAVALNLTEKILFRANMKIMASSSYISERNYDANAFFISPVFDINYRKLLYAPAYLENNYFGNHFLWNNDFSPTGSDNLTVIAKLPLKFLELHIGGTASRINNYIYYKEDVDNKEDNAKPEQAQNEILLIIPQVSLKINLKHFSVSNQAFFSNSTDNSIIRLPQIINNTILSFHNDFSKNIDYRIGIDVQYKSSYFADKYMPVTQQFYLQNEFKVKDQLVADIFLNVKVNRTRIFLKYRNLNSIEQLNMDPGFYHMPYYFSPRRTLDFGVNWMFFD